MIFKMNEEIKLLSEYTDKDKIKWFDELYGFAKNCSETNYKPNIDVYKSLFFNSAMDLLKSKKPLRCYEFIGNVIVNDYCISRIDLD